MKIQDIVDAAIPYGERFQKWLKFILDHECEFDKNGDIRIENVVNDKGSTTFAGLDKASHPNFNFTNPSALKVAQIYWWDYWSRVNAPSLKWPLGEVVANYGVNMGTGTAGKLLQSSINAMVSDGSKLAVDGSVGQKTIRTASALNPKNAANIVIKAGEDRYHSIVQNNPSQAKFLKGWLARNKDLSDWINS